MKDSKKPSNNGTATMMIPDVLRKHAHVRAVLDRYGLRDYGGSRGPAEYMAFRVTVFGVFARAVSPCTAAEPQ